MTVHWDLAYDRRVSEPFLAHFLAGGVASSLVEYARHAPYPVDLQMRHSPTTGQDHATLYVGLTSVLGVINKKGKLALIGHKSAANGAYGFDNDWTVPHDESELARVWRGVENYLEAIIPDATTLHASREGAVQAAVSVFAATERIMVDREVALHFRDTATKKQIFKEVTERPVNAVQHVPNVQGKPPLSFGGECDLIALDNAGRLLAVEVKPRNTGTIAWSGVQATVYARLFQRWIETALTLNIDAPPVVLRGMLDQRARLGLAPSNRPFCRMRLLWFRWSPSSAEQTRSTWNV